MGKVVIDGNTPKNPLTLIGKMIGPCYGSNTNDDEKNYVRGLRAVKDGHFRCLEYATAWFVLKGYSAKVIREFYTHIGGAPTRTQASTRYIKYKQFDYVIPPAIGKNSIALERYSKCMKEIAETTKFLQEECGIKAEDANMVLPLGMETTVSCHFNARTLMAMAEQRLCTRAYWEYREMMRDIITALSEYSEEWETICDMFFKVKCDKVHKCLEHQCCGRWPQKLEG